MFLFPVSKGNSLFQSGGDYESGRSTDSPPSFNYNSGGNDDVPTSFRDNPVQSGPENPSLTGKVLPPTIQVTEFNSFPSSFYSGPGGDFTVASVQGKDPSPDRSDIATKSVSGTANPFLSRGKVSQDREDSADERPRYYGSRDRVRFPPKMPFCPATCRCRCEANPK